jgi:hypothetical protein
MVAMIVSVIKWFIVKYNRQYASGTTLLVKHEACDLSSVCQVQNFYHEVSMLKQY